MVDVDADGSIRCLNKRKNIQGKVLQNRSSPTPDSSVHLEEKKELPDFRVWVPLELDPSLQFNLR